MSSDNNSLLPKVVGTVRASTSLGARDVDFCRSLDRDVSTSIDSNATEIVDMINSILVSIDPHCDQLEVGKEKLEDSWKGFSNLMDNLFEKSDRSLDILNKRRSAGKERKVYQYLDESTDNEATTSVRIPKPQLKFKTPVDNSESHPFTPLLTEKPHAIRPLSDCLKLVPEEDVVPEHYAQPYEYEIDHQEHNESVLVKAEPIASKPWNGTGAIWVDTVESMMSMMADLKKNREIAVDLEHHDYRSYYGIVCLMQISTRETDYLVDTIVLREDLKVLNEVFTDPKILKVLHGAFMDIIWLQRDLGIYVVNLFDTYHASRAIGLPRFSLAYLLEKYSNFKTSKKYQLADWRLRPLSKSMVAYARADTHFLLNIYDQLRNKLVEENKLAGVLFESRNVAKRRFEYTQYRPKISMSSVYSSAEKIDAWRTLIYQYNIPPAKEELLKRLYDWRDMIARRDDESSRYVMPNQLLVSLVEYGPVESSGVLSVSNILTDHVRSNCRELANLIKKTLESPHSDILKSYSGQNSTTNKQDVLHILTVPQIQQEVSLFNNFLDRFKQKIGDKSEGQGPILFGSILSGKPAAVDYIDGQHTQVTVEQLNDRGLNALNEMVSFDEHASFSIPISEPSTKANAGVQKIIENSVAESSVATNDIPAEKIELKEDMDEIVTLRKIKDRGGKRTHNKIANKETVDYEKGKKILQNNISKSRLPKKRAFDPYSASNDSFAAPAAPKKRKTAQRGKSASFKK